MELYRSPATPSPDPPSQLNWRETELAKGLRVEFSGARPSLVPALITWLFLASAVGMLSFVQIASGGFVWVLFVPFVAFGTIAVVKTWPYSSRGRLVIADGRVSIGGLRAAIDVASINEIACVRGAQEYSVNDETRTVRWFDAIARTQRGDRVLARFAEEECAKFFCERVCVLAKVPRR